MVFVVREAILDDVRNHFEKKLEGRIETQYICQDAGQVQLGPPRKNGEQGMPCFRLNHWSREFLSINADDFFGRNAFETMLWRLEKIDPQTNDFDLAGYRLKNTLSPGGIV